MTAQENGQYNEGQIFEAGDEANFKALPAVTFRVGDLFQDSPDTSL